MLFFVQILLCAFTLSLSPVNGVVSFGHTNFYGGGVRMGGDGRGSEFWEGVGVLLLKQKRTRFL